MMLNIRVVIWLSMCSICKLTMLGCFIISMAITYSSELEDIIL